MLLPRYDKVIDVDGCMLNLIYLLNTQGIKTLGCCCGHGKYQMTVVCEEFRDFKQPNRYELISGIEIPRKTRFYVKDKEGYYYIPEVEATRNDK